MKRFAALIATALLSGCGASATGNFREVECTAKYDIKTFVVAGAYEVNISGVRENRFGQKQYRMSVDNKSVIFVNRWQPSEYFYDVRCK